MGVEWWVLERLIKTVNGRLQKTLGLMRCDIIIYSHFFPILEFKYQRKKLEIYIIKNVYNINYKNIIFVKFSMFWPGSI